MVINGHAEMHERSMDTISWFIGEVQNNRIPFNEAHTIISAANINAEGCDRLIQFSLSERSRSIIMGCVMALLATVDITWMVSVVVNGITSSSEVAIFIIRCIVVPVFAWFSKDFFEDAMDATRRIKMERREYDGWVRLQHEFKSRWLKQLN